jgi:hypothetical protein
MDQAREVLAEQEFFVPRSELSAEVDERRAYACRLHVLLARTARRFEHSKQVVSGERPPDDELRLPESLPEAEAYLEDQSFFSSVADLPDDPDQIGEYIDTLHLKLARVARALRHNQRILHKRETNEESSGGESTGDGSGDDDTPGEAVDEQQTNTGAETREESTSGDETGKESTTGAETGEESTTRDETGEESTAGAETGEEVAVRVRLRRQRDRRHSRTGGGRAHVRRVATRRVCRGRRGVSTGSGYRGTRRERRRTARRVHLQSVRRSEERRTHGRRHCGRFGWGG